MHVVNKEKGAICLFVWYCPYIALCVVLCAVFMKRKLKK